MLHKRAMSKLSKPDRGFWDGCKNTTCQEMEAMLWKSKHSAVMTFFDMLLVPFLDTPCFSTHLRNFGNWSISASHSLCKSSLSDHAMSTYSVANAFQKYSKLLRVIRGNCHCQLLVSGLISRLSLHRNESAAIAAAPFSEIHNCLRVVSRVKVRIISHSSTSAEEYSNSQIESIVESSNLIFHLICLFFISLLQRELHHKEN
jgi:hypothetical protein